MAAPGTLVRRTLRTPLLRSTPTLRTLRQPIQKRFQSDAPAAAANAAEAATEQSAFQKLWNSPVGPKTVHFWAPIMKWGVVLAGVADFFRPAEALSLTQNLALMATGSIWTRWCFVIRPQNYFLATVNFFLFSVGTAQVSRVLMYRASQKNTSVPTEIVAAAKEESGLAKKTA